MLRWVAVLALSALAGCQALVGIEKTVAIGDAPFSITLAQEPVRVVVSFEGDLDGNNGSVASDVNEAGDVVGESFAAYWQSYYYWYYYWVEGPGTATLWRDGDPIALDGPYTRAFAVNDPTADHGVQGEQRARGLGVVEHRRVGLHGLERRGWHFVHVDLEAELERLFGRQPFDGVVQPQRVGPEAPVAEVVITEDLAALVDELRVRRSRRFGGYRLRREHARPLVHREYRADTHDRAHHAPHRRKT
jgi:hypothetical protein